MSTTTWTHPDDRPSEIDGPLWDADPTVCCAAFQLGACAHTEAFDPSYEPWTADEATVRLVLALVAPAPAPADDPF